MFVKALFRTLLTVSILLVPSLLSAQATPEQKGAEGVPYLNLTPPRHVLLDAQAWEGDEFPHTMCVLELNRGGFRYWGWYGLNEGRGVGLARSNDLVSWTKYEKNPLWTNARWPSVLANVDPKKKNLLYFAITREYDTPSSHIVLLEMVKSAARIGNTANATTNKGFLPQMSAFQPTTMAIGIITA